MRLPAPLGALAGNWRGEMIIDGTGERVPFTLLRDQSSDAAVAGRFLFFATRDVPPTGMKLLEAANSVFVALVGPYYCPRENADVMTVFEGTRDGQRIEGSFYTRVQNWRNTLRSGQFSATRAASSTRAA
ncbi:MAG: hypothetical protein IPF98_07465 [Gemmatimonadetes bacterium]|nr:hypothetical protein [Gemmatimonadota bacterium]MCC6774240.1 hypothetical protein [Gemmatimonadaceae bacterium]